MRDEQKPGPAFINRLRTKQLCKKQLRPKKYLNKQGLQTGTGGIQKTCGHIPGLCTRLHFTLGANYSLGILD